MYEGRWWKLSKSEISLECLTHCACREKAHEGMVEFAYHNENEKLCDEYLKAKVKIRFLAFLFGKDSIKTQQMKLEPNDE